MRSAGRLASEAGLAGREEVKSGEDASAGDALQGQLCREEPSFLAAAATLVPAATDPVRREALRAAWSGQVLRAVRGLASICTMDEVDGLHSPGYWGCAPFCSRGDRHSAAGEAPGAGCKVPGVILCAGTKERCRLLRSPEWVVSARPLLQQPAHAVVQRLLAGRPPDPKLRSCEAAGQHLARL